MRLVRRTARSRGIPAIATLHQPRSSIWAQLDDVVILAPGGEHQHLQHSTASQFNTVLVLPAPLPIPYETLTLLSASCASCTHILTRMPRATSPYQAVSSSMAQEMTRCAILPCSVTLAQCTPIRQNTSLTSSPSILKMRLSLKQIAFGLLALPRCGLAASQGLRHRTLALPEARCRTHRAQPQRQRRRQDQLAPVSGRMPPP